MRIVFVSVILGLTAFSTSAFGVPFVAPAGSNIFAAGFGTTTESVTAAALSPRVLLSLPAAGL
jgi:hypothetical protein